MAVDTKQYFNGIRSYLNSHYQISTRDNGRIVLEEKIFLSGQTRPTTYKVRFGFDGEVIVVNLDKKNSKGNSDPLFHFLEDEAKPWAKRCDFVVFQSNKSRINIYCFEFKSASLPEGLVDQLNASVAWCKALQSIIKLYTNKTKQMTLKKFVLSSMADPSRFLDAGKYIKRDHTIRHYNYDELTGLKLEDLEHENPEILR
ncbi:MULTISPECIES: hypothetical protein [unclassified Pseudomonas]|uniref:hypothetical protein n=1 Tax=unclassified Pseudomonas TaxID=196821 RepID=UPI0024496890|nr:MULTISPECIES: hypothetical protein [unclassified Pseudomonas]MDG9927894.1 hypothetical protein [Pseudomonas sp. GD04042]MDH0481903.1 hypothetical protein [Pseudomonas sp. GD04015]MDH0606462.1 hypothetical protein [Pseudomonas sp. GD03869]